MRPILPDILNLAQHLSQLRHDPESYRPERCPACGVAGLWSHGVYTRKADRTTGEMNPLPIPRFRCPHCQRTCSTLPECLPPRRWYLWAIQEMAFLALLLQQSFSAVARQVKPSRSTLRRWRRHGLDRFDKQALHLRNRFPEWGRQDGFVAFWSTVLQQHRLSAVMRTLNTLMDIP